MTVRLATFLVVGCMCLSLNAQHADIEFGYDNPGNPTSIAIVPDVLTCENYHYYLSEMVALDPFNPDDLGADDPGFATNLSEGLVVNTGDEVWLKAVDATQESIFGMGFVNYYNPSTDLLESSGQIAILDNTVSTGNLILDGSNESGPNPQFVDIGNSSGEIHDHVIFDLLDESNMPFGAYGILVQIQTDFAPADGQPDLTSAPMWIIFNHGMSQSDFETLALPKFGVLPSSGGFVDVDVESFNVTRGTYLSGGVAELASSDNSDLSARRSTSDISSRVFVELKTTTNIASPAVLEFTLEAAVFARSTVVQTIELFDYVSGTWEEVDSRNAARFIDSTATVQIGGNLGRFVEVGTGCMEARLKFQSVNPRQRFTANIDHVYWTLKN